MIQGYSQKDIKDYLIGRSFKPIYTNKNYIIDDVSFDRNVNNAEFLREGHSITLAKYYLAQYNIRIRDTRQPLIIVKRKENTLFFIPELCHLCGIDDDALFDRDFLYKFTNETKLIPRTRVERTEEFLNLIEDEDVRLNESEQREHLHEKNCDYSAKKKKELYGLDIKPSDYPFRSHILDSPSFNGLSPEATNKKGRGKITNSADKLWNNLYTAAKAFGLMVDEPTWLEMSSYDPHQWISAVESKLQKNNYKYVLYLIKNANDYKILKTHFIMHYRISFSGCKNEYFI